MAATAPEIGEFVRIRRDRWAVAGVHEPAQPSDGRTLVELLSVLDRDYSTELKLVWESSPGQAALVAYTNSAEETATGFDPLRLDVEVFFEEGWHHHRAGCL